MYKGYMQTFTNCNDDYFDRDELSSSLSILDEDINFNFVYALHTFVATLLVASSFRKGLSRYLLAEHIETPLERLARLNKYRNAELSFIDIGEDKNFSISGENKNMYSKDNKLVVFSVLTYIEYVEEECCDNTRYDDDNFETYEKSGIHDYINNYSGIYNDKFLQGFATHKFYEKQMETCINDSLSRLSAYIGIFEGSEIYKSEYYDKNDNKCDIYTKINDSRETNSLKDNKNDRILKTNDDALRVYLNDKLDSELYFFVKSIFSFSENDDIIYSEIHKLYVNIEFEPEKISQVLFFGNMTVLNKFGQNLSRSVDKIFSSCCGKCYYGSIAVSPICTIKVERTEYLLEETVPSLGMDVREIDEMAYCEIMEPIKCMDKLCNAGKKWLRTFNCKKKGSDNTFRFLNYIIENGLNTENRSKSSLSFFKRKITTSALHYRRSWPS
ncbi:hypothetical protein PCANB_002959 [Pneumocystis canis]|nr:hypothetical protein PCANB_002959 [Pneumocystis canis]